MVKIYTLVDPRHPTVVRYVGKTQRTLDARLRSHIWEAGSGLKSHRHHWIASLTAAGITPIILLIEEVPDEGWQEHEKRWIKHFRDTGHPLTNTSNGGDGSDSEVWKSIWASPDLRKRQSAALKAHNANPLIRAKKSAETKARYADPAARQKASEKMKAVLASPAARERMSVTAKTGWAIPAERQKRLAGIVAYQETEEARIACAARLKIRWSDPAARIRASEAAKRRWNNPEMRQRIINAQRDSYSSPEARLKSSNAKKIGWEKRRANQTKENTCA